ncbi:hypothetical protein HY229_07205 [Candidatus Acetothermia bacterium]|nr:hypothetical protein [Candidatus Acetothermia bacterium]MBI3643866.1 hypothetical protein [Candidatus Acetothermia bacterium]
MIRGLYIVKEMIRSFQSKTWTLLLSGILGWAFLFIVLSLVSVLTQTQDTRQGARLWVIPQPSLAQSDLEDLQQRLNSAPEILSARYLFSTDSSPGAVEHFEITLRAGVSADSAMAQFQTLPSVQSVSLPIASNPGSFKTFAANPVNRDWLLGAGIVLWLFGLLVVRWGMIAAKRDFSGELELLELAGVNPRTVRAPFLILGGLIALANAILIGIFSFTLLFWISILSSSVLKELTQPGMIELTALRGVLLGLAISGIVSLVLGFFTYRYPKPFNLSRISSSSAAVREP